MATSRSVMKGLAAGWVKLLVAILFLLVALLIWSKRGGENVQASEEEKRSKEAREVTSLLFFLIVLLIVIDVVVVVAIIVVIAITMLARWKLEGWAATLHLRGTARVGCLSSTAKTTLSSSLVIFLDFWLICFGFICKMSDG